ncbi:Conserved_hypothetical protein [Hexamita inflata]|uniref:Transmembrane protein n=1 Tax=Hexamita inflata TaxID=28002 RepID=A0AA86Q8N2_9EUKA|nr:Conserved hypothetical protein [Hexamita inflata]
MTSYHKLQLCISVDLFLSVKNRKLSIIAGNDDIVLQNEIELPDSLQFRFFPIENSVFLLINQQIFEITGNLQLLDKIDEKAAKYFKEQMITNNIQINSLSSLLEFESIDEYKFNTVIFELSRLAIEKYCKNRKQTQIQEKIMLFPENYIEKHQLMNVIKLLPDYDLYMAIENNRIRIINQDFLIIGEIKVDFDFYTKYKNPNYCNGNISVYAPQQYTACVNCGVIYIQYFDKIYKIYNAELVFVVQIPNIQLECFDQFQNRMFSLNEDLYFNCFSGHTYIIRDNTLHRVQSIGARFYQFAKQIVVMTHQNEEITLNQLQNNLDQSIIQVVPQIKHFSFSGGGITILILFEIIYGIVINVFISPSTIFITRSQSLKYQVQCDAINIVVPLDLKQPRMASSQIFLPT